VFMCSLLAIFVGMFWRRLRAFASR
jgi:hypothetical protein